MLAQPVHARPTVLREARQLIVVTTPDWDAVQGELRRYERASPGGRWKAVGDAIPVVVGKKGLGWGAGAMSLPNIHASDPVKKEGDLKAPAGVFRLGTAFGYAAAAPASWEIPYLPLTPAIECVDDVHSRSYNQVVNRAKVEPDWNSSEHMRAVGEYRWGAVIDQNPAAVPGGGSCVFLHIWDGGSRGTEGCTAMPEPKVEVVLGWLNPRDNPLLVQMPVAQYRQVEKLLHQPKDKPVDR